MNLCNGFFYYSRNDLYMIEETNNNYCVYVHTCPDGVYYGVTCNVKNRWSSSRYRNGTPFKDAITKFGWKNITHDVLFENLTRDEALKIEDELICKARENGVCLNANRSGHYQQTDEYKDERKVQKKAYRDTHPEELKAYQKAYYEANKDEINARNKAWQKAHPEKRKVIDKAYYEAHPEECKARTKAWREAHPEEYNAYMREYRKRKKAEKQAQQSDVDEVKPTKPKSKRKKPLF